MCLTGDWENATEFLEQSRGVLDGMTQKNDFNQAALNDFMNPERRNPAGGDLTPERIATQFNNAMAVMDSFNMSTKPSLMICGSDVTDATYVLSTLPMNLASIAPN